MVLGLKHPETCPGKTQPYKKLIKSFHKDHSLPPQKFHVEFSELEVLGLPEQTQAEPTLVLVHLISKTHKNDLQIQGIIHL